MRFPLLLDKYVFVNLSKGLLLSVSLLLSLDILFAVIGQLNDISGGYSIGDVFYYVLLTIPGKIYETFAVSAVIAVLLSLGALAAGSELIVFMASGVSRLRMALTVMLTLVFWLVPVVLTGEYLAPRGEQMAQAHRTAELTEGQGLATADGVWIRDGQVILNANRMARQSDRAATRLLDVTIFELDDKRVQRVSKAREAVHDGRQWLFRDLQVSEFDDEGVHTRTMDQQLWQSRIEPAILNISLTRPKHLSVRDLKRYESFVGNKASVSSAYQVALWSKLTYPLFVLATALSGVLFLFGSLRGGGFSQRLIIGLTLGVVLYLLNKTLLNIGEVYHVQPFVVTVLPWLLILLVTYLMMREKRVRSLQSR